MKANSEEQGADTRPVPRLIVKLDSEPKFELQMKQGDTLSVEYRKGLPIPGDTKNETTPSWQVPPSQARHPPKRPPATSFALPFPQDPVRKEMDGSPFSRRPRSSPKSLKDRIRDMLMRLSEERLRDFVYFKLERNWDDFPSPGKSGKIRDLIQDYESLGGENGSSFLYRKVEQYVGEVQSTLILE